MYSTMPPTCRPKRRNVFVALSKERRGEEIAGREILFTNIEPVRTITEPTKMNSPGVALNDRVSFTSK